MILPFSAHYIDFPFLRSVGHLSSPSIASGVKWGKGLQKGSSHFIPHISWDPRSFENSHSIFFSLYLSFFFCFQKERLLSFELSYLLITLPSSILLEFFFFFFFPFFLLVLGHAAGSESVKSQLLASPLVVPSFKHFSVQTLSLSFIFAGRLAPKNPPHKRLWPKKITNRLLSYWLTDPFDLGTPLHEPTNTSADRQEKEKVVL